MISVERLKKMKMWVGFVGIMTMIGAVLQIVCGVIFFIALLGLPKGTSNIIPIMLGPVAAGIAAYIAVKLLKTKNALNKLILTQPEDQTPGLTDVIDNLTTYFKVISLIFIASLVFVIISFLVVSTYGLSLYYNSL